MRLYSPSIPHCDISTPSFRRRFRGSTIRKPRRGRLEVLDMFQLARVVEEILIDMAGTTKLSQGDPIHTQHNYISLCNDLGLMAFICYFVMAMVHICVM